MKKNKNFYAVNKFELKDKVNNNGTRSSGFLNENRYEIEKTIDTTLRRITLQPVIKSRR
jgi:hypothetical protein